MKKRWISGTVIAGPVGCINDVAILFAPLCSSRSRTHCEVISMCRRSKDDASAKQLRQAADLLKSAAGVSLGMSIPVEETAVNATRAEANGSEDDFMSRHYHGLEIMDNGHIGALKELVACYELGMPKSSKLEVAANTLFAMRAVRVFNGLALVQGKGSCSIQQLHSSCCEQLQNAAIPKHRQSWASAWPWASIHPHRVN